MNDDILGKSEEDEEGFMDIEQVKEKMNMIKEQEEVEEPKNQNAENEEIPEDNDIIKMIALNSQKEEKVLPDGNDFTHFECFFKKIKINKKNIDSFPPDIIKNWNESYGIFCCYKDNEITKEKCEPEKELCPNCMKNTQKIYGLKPHYLINSMGRVCTYKKNKIYCLGKFSKIIEEKNIKYSINYVCGHSGQCDSCKSLSEKMNKYFGSKLMDKLLERDNMVN